MKEDAQHEASFQGKSKLKKYCISIMVVVASLVPYVLGVFCCYLACILAEIWLADFGWLQNYCNPIFLL